MFTIRFILKSGTCAEAFFEILKAINWAKERDPVCALVQEGPEAPVAQL